MVSLKSRTCRCLLLAAVLACSTIVQAATSAGGITVVSPEDGTIVRPGETVPVVITVDSSLNPASVHFWPNMRTRLTRFNFEHAPYEGELRIPSSMTGYAEIQVFLRTTDQKFVEGPTITIRVVPDDTPVSIDVPTNIKLHYPEGEIGGGGITVFGVYANGIRRAIGGAEYGTSYQTSDLAVVTVNESGELTATGAGVAYITTENAGHKALTQVQVYGSGPSGQSRWPTVEETGRVAITKSEIRRDPESGLLVQSIQVTNTSDLPISRPLRLVVSGLPEGVELVNSRGDTKVVEPRFSQYVPVEIEEDAYLSPGTTGTSLLKFSNRDGVPIKYRLRVFSGRDL